MSSFQISDFTLAGTYVNALAAARESDRRNSRYRLAAGKGPGRLVSLFTSLKRLSGTIAGLGIAPARTTMREIDQNLHALLDDRMALLAVQVDHKADATGIADLRGVVQTAHLGGVGAITRHGVVPSKTSRA